MTKPSSWKDKGRAFQQKIRNLFCALGGLVPETDVASRQMGGKGEDVVFLTEKAKSLFGEFYVECKAEKTGFNPHKFFEQHQVTLDRATGRCLLLFHKRDRGPTLVTMDEHTFKHLVEAKFGRGLIREADMRAIHRWQQETGRTLTCPDREEVIFWLLKKLDALEEANQNTSVGGTL